MVIAFVVTAAVSYAVMRLLGWETTTGSSIGAGIGVAAVVYFTGREPEAR